MMRIFGLANIDVMLGITPSIICFMLLTEKRFRIYNRGTMWYKIYIRRFRDLGIDQFIIHKLEEFMDMLEGLDNIADIILIDTGAGVSEEFLKWFWQQMR